MSSPIATLYVDKPALMSSVFSKQHLYETRNDENGPLRRVMAWLYDQEGGVSYNSDNIRFGSPDKDYALLYYFEGRRYKILWNGKAYISGADPENMYEADEKSLQALIDSILADTLHLRFARMASHTGARCGKAKRMGEDDGSPRTKMMFGVVGDAGAGAAKKAGSPAQQA